MKTFLKLASISALTLVLFVLWKTVPSSAFTGHAPAQAQAPMQAQTAQAPAPKPCVNVEASTVSYQGDYEGSAYSTGEASPEVIVTNNCPYRVNVTSHFRISRKDNGIELRTGTIDLRGLLPGKVGRFYRSDVRFDSHDAECLVTSAEIVP